MLRRVWGRKGMWGSKLGSRAIPALFVATMAASPAFSATVALTSVTGTFENALWNVDYYGLKNRTFAELEADSREVGEQFIRDLDSALWWGSTHTSWQTTSELSDAQKDAQSGYVFEGIDSGDGFTTTSDEFTFGRAIHHNGAVWSNSATLASVDFRIEIEGTIDGQAFSLSALFNLLHNETLNPYEPCDNGDDVPCGDDVGIGGSIAVSQPIESGGYSYVFELEGLVKSIDGPTVTSFFTDEYGVSEAMLRARLVATPLNPIPLPAAGWLLIAGLGGLAAVARKRRPGA